METKFKNVLITGASSGIGEAMALYYAASGSENLFICGRNKERLNEVKHQCEKFGAKVYASLIDVNDREKMRAWINQSNKKAALNLVLANAGVATTKENDENVYNTFNTNVFGVLNTVLPAVALFSKRRGKGVKAIAMLNRRLSRSCRLSVLQRQQSLRQSLRRSAQGLSGAERHSDQRHLPGFCQIAHYRQKYLPDAVFHAGGKSGGHHRPRPGKQRRPDCFPLADAAGRLVFIRSAELCQQFHLFQTALQGVTAPAKPLFAQTGGFKNKKRGNLPIRQFSSLIFPFSLLPVFK